MSFCLLVLPPSCINLFAFWLTPAQLLGDDLLIKRCAANMTLAFITHQKIVLLTMLHLCNGAANIKNLGNRILVPSVSFPSLMVEQ
jgi:hypothetical protein